MFYIFAPESKKNGTDIEIAVRCRTPFQNSGIHHFATLWRVCRTAKIRLFLRSHKKQAKN